MHASDVNPNGPKPKFAQSGCSGNQRFLLPAVKGSATISVPLSVHTHAAQREKGREVEKELERGQTSQREGGRQQRFFFLFFFEENRMVMSE